MAASAAVETVETVETMETTKEDGTTTESTVDEETMMPRMVGIQMAISQQACTMMLPPR
jgi:hypothetical protein